MIALRRALPLALLALVAGLGILVWQRPAPLPAIQGVILPTASPVRVEQLRDHLGQPFEPARLLGRWHLVSYGYLGCPDICPTTLALLARLKDELDRRAEYDDLGLLFYTVDPGRDTADKLAAYLQHFHRELIGLRGDSDAFARSLGIQARLTPEPDGGYRVAHGVLLYLLNPRGELQAVFQPDAVRTGLPHFTLERLLRDYLAVRAHLSPAHLSPKG